MEEFNEKNKKANFFTEEERKALKQGNLMRKTAEETEKPEDKETLEKGADAFEKIMFKAGTKKRKEEN